MRIHNNQQLGDTRLILIPYLYHDYDLYLVNNNSPFPAQNVVVGQRK